MSTLYLNADYQPMELSPLSVLSWRDSISAYFKDSVYIYKTHDNWLVRSPNLELQVPSIIVAKQFHKRKTNAKLSRKNLFIRDNYHCQYCNVRFYHHELTWDHVVPRSAGGNSNWDNIVATCKSCKWKKGSRRDVGPVRKPYTPSWREIYNQSKCYKITIPDPAWQEFLNWPEELLEIKTPVY